MPYSRRHLLQFAATTLTTLGLNLLDLQHRSHQYARVLAQSTPRKKALLVGVNAYPTSPRFTNLKGCLTDVALQRELLIHRFGFQPDDILTLTDETPDRPTRANILTAFEEHLIRNTQPGDVVVFHFSGHGSRLQDPNPIRSATGELIPRNGSFVPADDASLAARTVSDIMGKTLFLLMSAVNTENLTVILDSCYSGGGIRGNQRVRSTRGNATLSPSAIELDYQERWRQILNLTPEQLEQRRNRGVAKGVVIAAANPNQKAADVQFDGFDAGAFTYFLTQYLWQDTNSVQSALAQVTHNLQQALIPQEPLPGISPDSTAPQSPVYFADAIATATPPAEGVILSTNGDRGTIWLGGIDSRSITTFGANATLMAIGQPNQVITVLSRQGLTATVRLPRALPRGTLLQEATRVIPAGVQLRIGLDPSLAHETVKAQQLLQARSRLQAVLPQLETSLYPGEIHYILSRMTEQYRQLIQSNSPLPDLGSIGLFSPGLDEIIPGSFGAPEESIENAINSRLAAKLAALVTAHLIKLALNTTSSDLNLEASLSAGNRASGATAFTVRGSRRSLSSSRNFLRANVGDSLQFSITNRESVNLYLAVMVLDSGGDIFPVLPSSLTSSVEETIIRPNQTRQLPDRPFGATEPGIGEALILASPTPMRQALLALRTERGVGIPYVDALLADLSGVQLSRGEATARYQIPTTGLAALSIGIEVV